MLVRRRGARPRKREAASCAGAWPHRPRAEGGRVIKDPLFRRSAYKWFALMVVCSATAPYRTDYSRRGKLSGRQMHMANFLRWQIEASFWSILDYHQSSSRTSGWSVMFAGPQIKPIDGNIMAHASAVRLALRKGRWEEQICKVISSLCLPEAKARFQIASEGVTDVKD